jgi:hypothetical protein
VPTGGEWFRLPEGREGAPPPLPRHTEWEPATRAWWKQIWATPMATQWTEGDVPALIELAALRQHLLSNFQTSLAAEVRLRSDSFGLTPKGRQSLRWELPRDESEPKSKPIPERWTDLRVVDDPERKVN